MRRSSKTILAVCGILAFVLAAVYIPILAESRPDFTQRDAQEMLTQLAAALMKENASEAASFAHPDADIAGRNLRQIHDMLQRGFSAVRNLVVSFSEVRYSRQGEIVSLQTRVFAGEKDPTSHQFSEVYYDRPAEFTIARRAIPHLGGLFHTYDWKITKVVAPGLPLR